MVAARKTATVRPQSHYNIKNSPSSRSHNNNNKIANKRKRNLNWRGMCWQLFSILIFVISGLRSVRLPFAIIPLFFFFIFCLCLGFFALCFCACETAGAGARLNWRGVDPNGVVNNNRDKFIRKNGKRGRSSIVIGLSFDITFCSGCESKLCVPLNRFSHIVFGCNFIELRFEKLPENKGCEK